MTLRNTMSTKKPHMVWKKRNTIKIACEKIGRIDGEEIAESLVTI